MYKGIKTKSRVWYVFFFVRCSFIHQLKKTTKTQTKKKNKKKKTTKKKPNKQTNKKLLGCFENSSNYWESNFRLSHWT